MPLNKADVILEYLSFDYDDDGNVVDVRLTINYSVVDEDTGKNEGRLRKTESIWDKLNAQQKQQLGIVGRRLNVLAGQL